MLDIEKRTPEQQKTAENAIKDSKVLAELLNGLLSKKTSVRYNNFKAVYLISEEHPEVLYPKWDFFVNMLVSKENALTFQAVHILANLAKVNEAGRFQKIFEQFYDLVNGDELIPAAHVAYVSHKIVKANPELANKITDKLLNLDKATYKHKELVQANALKSFSEYFDSITDKDKIVSLAKELQKNKSSKAKKEATEFLKKWRPK